MSMPVRRLYGTAGGAGPSEATGGEQAVEPAEAHAEIGLSWTRSEIRMSNRLYASLYRPAFHALHGLS
jgi:hypothetical protein